MRARDVMTTDVVSVVPDMPVSEVARVLLQRGISAAPVVDATGAVVGIVSEGDLIGRPDADRQARRDWWLALLAEGGELHPDFLASLHQTQRTARDVMAAPVIRVGEDTEVAEIARLLREYRIKRVPVVRDGRVVGIVSRADLLRSIADGPAPPQQPAHDRPHGLLADFLASLESSFNHHRPASPHEAGSDRQERTDGNISADDFRGLVADFEHRKAEAWVEARRAAVEQRRSRVKALVDVHFTDAAWRGLLHRAREAAEHGEKELMLLRFPSALCSDGGRAVNALQADWPRSLRGEPAELYLRWERDLKPKGFRLAARVLDFPGGRPGDIGLFLVWGV